MPIIRTNIIEDTRDKNRPGLVIAEHIFDDGEVWPAVFEARASEDAATRLQSMIPDREAQRSVNDDAKAKAREVQGAIVKRDGYIKALPDKTLTDAGFTPEEVEIIKGASADQAAVADNAAVLEP